MMNEMPFQGQGAMWGMPPMGPGMMGPGPSIGNDPSFSERLNNLENQINRLERQLRRMDNRLNRIESSMITPLASQDTGYGNNSNKYMM